jgi:hypothetical protein
MPDCKTLFRFGLAAFALSGAPTSATAASAQPAAVATEKGQCEQPAFSGGGVEGCYVLSSSILGPMPKILYWHIDLFPDQVSAEAARTLYGTVTIALGGQIFLQTVNDNPGWTAPGGQRVAMLGPLFVRDDADVTARFMEITGPVMTSPGTPAGPRAIFVLSGSACVETPSGGKTMESGQSEIIPTGVPETVASEDLRALVLVVHPTTGDWLGPLSEWKPTGACRKPNVNAPAK